MASTAAEATTIFFMTFPITFETRGSSVSKRRRDREIHRLNATLRRKGGVVKGKKRAIAA
jgi:hypothetical protein